MTEEEMLTAALHAELNAATDEELDKVKAAIDALYPRGATRRQAVAVLIEAAALHRVHDAPKDAWMLLAEVVYDGISVERVVRTRGDAS